MPEVQEQESGAATFGVRGVLEERSGFSVVDAGGAVRIVWRPARAGILLELMRAAIAPGVSSP